jgi:hypothetical protein
LKASRQEKDTRLNPLKPLLSIGVRSRVFTGLIVLVLGALTMLPAVPTLASGSGTWALTGSLLCQESFASAELYTP